MLAKAISYTLIIMSTCAFAARQQTSTHELSIFRLSSSSIAQSVTPTQIISLRARPAVTPAGAHWLDSNDAAPDSNRVSRATKTESAILGTVRLIDVGDYVESLAEYLRQQARLASNQHEKCLLVAVLPSCPGCAALGYALATAVRGAPLPATRVIRVDIEEFEQDLAQMGLLVDQLPVFAMLDVNGRIIETLDIMELSSNAPTDFLPLLSNFIHGRLGHCVGSSFQRATANSIEL